jgi:hypothetical protein
MAFHVMRHMITAMSTIMEPEAGSYVCTVLSFIVKVEEFGTILGFGLEAFGLLGLATSPTNLVRRDLKINVILTSTVNTGGIYICWTATVPANAKAICGSPFIEFTI